MFETLFKYPLDRFVKGTVKLGSRLPPELAVLAVIVALVAAVFFYRRAPAAVPRRTRTTLSILRGIVLGLLVLILFQPVLRTPMPVTKDCFVPVLMENKVNALRNGIRCGSPFGDEARVTDSLLRLSLEHTRRRRGRPRKES